MEEEKDEVVRDDAATSFHEEANEAEQPTGMLTDPEIDDLTLLAIADGEEWQKVADVEGSFTMWRSLGFHSFSLVFVFIFGTSFFRFG